MPKEQVPGKPQTRRYSPEKAAAVRMVRTLRAELGTEHGTVQRVVSQLGYGVESVRQWVKQADIDDGHAPGVSTTEAKRIKELERRTASSAGPTRSSSAQRLSSGQCHPEWRPAGFARFFGASRFDGLSSMCGSAGRPGRAGTVA
jgi:transposase